MMKLTSKAQNWHIVYYIKGAYEHFTIDVWDFKLVSINLAFNSGSGNSTYVFQVLGRGTENNSRIRKIQLTFF